MLQASQQCPGHIPGLYLDFVHHHHHQRPPTRSPKSRGRREKPAPIRTNPFPATLPRPARRLSCFLLCYLPPRTSTQLFPTETFPSIIHLHTYSLSQTLYFYHPLHYSWPILLVVSELRPVCDFKLRSDPSSTRTHNHSRCCSVSVRHCAVLRLHRNIFPSIRFWNPQHQLRGSLFVDIVSKEVPLP